MRRNADAKAAVDLEARFWARVVRRGVDQCWPWNGSRQTQGYGRMEVRGRALAAHRLSYMLNIGSIPEGAVIDHLCRNKACVNPAHLEAVTLSVNATRAANP